MNSIVKRFFSVFAALAISFFTVAAQDEQPPIKGKAAERIEQFKKIRIMEVLALDEQNSIKFFARYNKNLEAMKDLRQKQVQALARIQNLRNAKASDNEYAKVVNELRSLEDQTHQAKSRYIDDLKDVLTNKQLAEYLVFEVRFQQNLRDLVRDVQQKRQELQKQ
jgi:hypothetical protein